MHVTFIYKVKFNHTQYIQQLYSAACKQCYINGIQQSGLQIRNTRGRGPAAELVNQMNHL